MFIPTALRTAFTIIMLYAVLALRVSLIKPASRKIVIMFRTSL